MKIDCDHCMAEFNVTEEQVAFTEFAGTVVCPECGNTMLKPLDFFNFKKTKAEIREEAKKEEVKELVKDPEPLPKDNKESK